jgi:hypothetical protein
MKTYRKTAVAVGILYILATAFALLGSALSKGITGAADHLGELAASGDRMVAGALLAVAAGLCVVVLAGLLFPVLRQRNEGAALAYFGVRILEAVTLIVTAVTTLLLVTVGRESLASGVAAGSSLRTTAALLQGLHEWAFPLNPFVFGLGAVILYVLLYQTRLVPRWLSVWGLVGAAGVFVFSLLMFYGGGTKLLAIPIGVQEMVLAGWLIVRGFDVSALTSQAAKRRDAAPARDLRETPTAPVIARPRTDP